MTVLKETYRIRKSWSDSKSQVGAYINLNNAKIACDKAGSEYKVYNSKGEIVYIPKEKTVDPKYIWNYFKKQGLSDCGIAGLMGNLYVESGFNSKNLQNSYEKTLKMTDEEYTLAVDNGTYTNFVNDRAGYGLAQWTYWSLKQDLLNFCKQKKQSIGDLDTQLEFLSQQLATDYKEVWQILKTAKTVLEASNAMLLKFERPADQSEKAQTNRAQYGQKYYDQFASKVIKKIQIPKEGGVGQMKYSTSNKPLCCMQTQSTCYKGTSIMKIKGILWHSTGANNPKLARYVQPSDKAADRDSWIELLGENKAKNDWNHTERNAGLNCWIGELADGTVTTVQTMPWNYRPWGCGSGSKGSCNNGWIQFEICEDNLENKDYFNKIYKEACEITAYLCKLYNINPFETVTMNNIKIPTITCHGDANKLGFASGHADINHWFPKYGKSMATVREDVGKLLGIVKEKEPDPIVFEYFVRKDWEDEKTQKGQFTSLTKAKAACDKAGKDYEVYNKNGIAVYPKEPVKEIQVEPSQFKVGQAISLLPGATYASGKAIPGWVFKSKLYVRQIYPNGNIVFSTQKTGAVTGAIEPKYVIKYVAATAPKVEKLEEFNSYIVRITVDVLNVRTGPGTGYRITKQVKKHELYTIVDEKNGWGKLKSGAGWISLLYTKKV